MTRSVVIGAGIMGLSIAWELAKRGHRVTVVQRGQIGRQASWAGAGILVPANQETAIHPLFHSHSFDERRGREGCNAQLSNRLVEAGQ